MSLNERLREYKSRQEAGEVPPITPDHLEVIYREAHALAASGAEDRVLKVGAPFPSFELPDENGELISSADLLSRGPLAVVFYRGVWCDYCNFELEALEEVYPRIKELGADLVAISPVTMPMLRAAIRRNNLSYRILSDRGNVYAARFNLTYRMNQDLLDVWGSFGMDFSKINGDDSNSMTMPGVFLADTDGVLRFATAYARHWERTEPADLLAAIERLSPDRSVRS
ncbi:peroxiredoxin-like family protein [Micromonospora sp. NPDC007230]|uniref:peroxiredoxin-like family protein n=1 Tax=Micromonospora sp. NPDC007230 TaxID=3364237 RepID=UPI0036A1DCD9